MKTFREFFYQDKNQLYLDIANKIAEQHNMPKPTNLLAKGGFALIFNTINPNIIARVSDTSELNNACDYVISRPEIQATGGVNKILAMFENNDFLVMFKEKLNDNWQPYFKHIFIELKPIEKILKINSNRFKIFDLESIHEIINSYIDNNEKMPFEFLFTKRILMELPMIIPESSMINFLDSLEIKEIKNLVEAIKKGLPIGDLHRKNLALDKNNNLVAIDC
jgi:hypothetical protein